MGLLGHGQSLGTSMDEDERDCTTTRTQRGAEPFASVHACLSSSSLAGYTEEQLGEHDSDTHTQNNLQLLTSASEGGATRTAAGRTQLGPEAEEERRRKKCARRIFDALKDDFVKRAPAVPGELPQYSFVQAAL